MSPAGNGVDHHLALFGRLEAGRRRSEPAWLSALRKTAIAGFAELGFPTPAREEWKHTNVAALVRTDFELATEPAHRPSVDDLMHLDPSDEASARLVFVDGFLSLGLSAVQNLPAGARVGSLGARLEEDPALLEGRLARHAPMASHAFVALNTAFFRDGAFVHIGRGVEVPGAIHVVFLSTGETPARVVHPRLLVVAEQSSRAALAESYLSLGDGPAFTNAVTEIVLEANSAFDHVKWQQENEAAFHVSALEVHQERDSRYTSHAISAGARLSRNDVRAVLAGEGAHCVLNGLFAAAGEQHVDNHTTVDHTRPHGHSSQLYKGILSERARGVFNGRIIVRPDAQKTDARQSNRNLLMSDRAEIDTMPQLEIHADDVKCTHGSTVGHLEEDALFYLRSRGIDLRTARGVLMRAFASEVTRGIHSVGLRARVEELLLSRLTPSAAGADAVARRAAGSQDRPEPPLAEHPQGRDAPAPPGSGAA
jgi:Fe-S cluster assembly protein SufD